MAMTKKDFREIAHKIAYNSKSYQEAMRTVEIIYPALNELSGLDVNGNRRFDKEIFRDFVADLFITFNVKKKAGQ